MNEQAVELVDGDWVGTCDHGAEGVWTIHRGNEHNAWRSLRAHATEHAAPAPVLTPPG